MGCKWRSNNVMKFILSLLAATARKWLLSSQRQGPYSRGLNQTGRSFMVMSLILSHWGQDHSFSSTFVQHCPSGNLCQIRHSKIFAWWTSILQHLDLHNTQSTMLNANLQKVYLLVHKVCPKSLLCNTCSWTTFCIIKIKGSDFLIKGWEIIPEDN